MVLQKAVKSYPMVKWFLILSAILVILGLVMSKVLSDPDNADRSTLLLFLAGAVVLPFLAMLFPRRQVHTIEMPTDHLAGMSKTELEGVLSQLDAAKAKGEMDDTRYGKARERVLDAIKARGRAK
ncbi:MAG TPA: hypothetical protein VM327_02595 [Candidatus Thermoplasmatota archaeon]|nr:hypothetical protein [Candidatus Thermoplasmatota archaeon]